MQPDRCVPSTCASTRRALLTPHTLSIPSLAPRSRPPPPHRLRIIDLRPCPPSLLVLVQLVSRRHDEHGRSCDGASASTLRFAVGAVLTSSPALQVPETGDFLSRLFHDGGESLCNVLS